MGLEENKQYEQLQLDVGQDLTLEEFARLMHSEKDGFVTVAQKDNESNWSERNYRIEDWFNYIMIDPKISSYNSVNTFYKPQRGNDNARHLQFVFADLDVYNEGISKEEAIDGIEFLTRTERLLEPTFLIDSGRGIYALWKIESVPGKFKNVQKLYGHIENFIIEMTKDLGSDQNARDVSRVLRTPGTFNPKSDSMVKVLRYSEKTYTLRLFQELMNDVNGVDWSITEKKFIRSKRIKKHKKKSGKIKRLFNFYTLAVNRSRDLEKLCELRSQSIYGYLNSLLHIYCYQMMLVHQDHYVARHLTKELNGSLKEQLSNQEIKDLSKSVHKAYQRHLKDSSKGYNYKTDTIVKKLKITVAEQKEMKALISTNEKRQRDYASRRKNRRDEDGLTPKQCEIKERTKKVMQLHKKGLNQIEIAQEIGIHKSTISRILSEKPKVAKKGVL